MSVSIYDAETAAMRAEQTKRNDPGMCQQFTRELYKAPSVGDLDKDGDADAVDGMKAEPKKFGDRNPPRGAPVGYSKGDGHGHRAISLGRGMIRSTDAGGRGIVATVPLDWPEKHWGMKYRGWTPTISGILIPKLNVVRDKSISDLVAEVLAGKWGNGDTRVNRLTAAGYDADAIQFAVNRKLR